MSESMKLLLGLASVGIPAFAALVLFAMLWAIADEEVRRHSVSARTDIGHIMLARRTPKGRKLFPWYLIAQVYTMAALIRLMIVYSE